MSDQPENSLARGEKHWSEAEDAQLKDLYVNQGMPLDDIAKIIGRTPLAIRRRKEILCLPWVGGRKRWRNEEDEILRKMYYEKHPLKEIAKMLGRKPKSIADRISRLGIGYTREETFLYKDPEIEAKIRVMYENGDSYGKIGEALDIDKVVVRRVVNRIGLPIREKKEMNGYKNHYGEELVKTVIDHYLNTKYSMKEISRIVDVPVKTLHRILTSRKVRRKRKDWKQWQLDKMLAMLAEGKSATEVSLEINKTVWSVVDYCKYLQIRDQYSSQLVVEKHDEKTSFILQKIISCAKADSKRGWETDITLEYILKLGVETDWRCFYLNEPLEFKPHVDYSFSIDRIDSKRGHTKDNVVLCSWAANYIKQDLSLEEFQSLCERISKNDPVAKWSKVKGQ